MRNKISCFMHHNKESKRKRCEVNKLNDNSEMGNFKNPKKIYLQDDDDDEN
jgi:hypothetical protein